MSKFLVLLLSFNLSLWSLEFHTYKEALKIQKQNKKIIMIDVVRTDCHYCQNMKKEVFDDKEMSNWIKKRFIPVEVNLDTGIPPLGIKVHFTPSFFFINEEQEIVKKIPGSWNIQDFKDLTKNIK